jgi:tetratricopeptide (TPR) repeat protein
LRPDTRAKCLQILATCDRECGNLPGAAALLEQGVRLRRSADDWRLLGANYLDDGKPEKAVPAFQQSLAIRPFRPATHLGLAECYRRLGDGPRAREHAEKAQWLQLHRQN